MNRDELGAVTTEIFTIPEGGGDPQPLQTIRQSVEEVTVSADGGITAVTQSAGMKIHWTLDAALWGLLSRWYGIRAEDRKPVTDFVLCSDCKHHRSGWVYGQETSAVKDDRCTAVRLAFVNSNILNFATCSSVNADGRCKLHQPLPPPPPVPPFQMKPYPWWEQMLDDIREPGPLVLAVIMVFIGILIGYSLR